MRRFTKKQKEHWKLHIEAWQKSPISMLRYCNENGLSYSTFIYLKNQLVPKKTVRKKQDGSFAEIEYSPRNTRSNVSSNGNILIFLGNDFNPQTLNQVLQALGGV